MSAGYLDEHELPDGALVIRRTEVVVYLDPDNELPEVSIVAADGTGDAQLDLLAHVGDLSVAQLQLWHDR